MGKKRNLVLVFGLILSIAVAVGFMVPQNVTANVSEASLSNSVGEIIQIQVDLDSDIDSVVVSDDGLDLLDQDDKEVNLEETITAEDSEEVNDTAISGDTINFELEQIGSTSNYMITSVTTKASSVTIPSVSGYTITTIGTSAFENCDEMTSLDLTKLTDLTTINERAFFECNSLATISFPDSVTSFGRLAFYNTRWLTIQRGLTSDKLVIVNNVLVDGGKASGDVVIPSTVTSMSEGVFAYNTKITSVTITSVTEIPYQAFISCTKLTTVDIQDSVTSIEKAAFYGCVSLNELNLSDPIASIGDFAFYGCESLETLDFSELTTLTSIGYSAFQKCTALTSVVFNQQFTDVGVASFAYCTSLTRISFCSSLGQQSFEEASTKTINLGSGAFGGCKKLATVNYYSTNATINLGNCVYRGTIFASA